MLNPTETFFRPKAGDRVTWNHAFVYDHAPRRVRDLKRVCQGPFEVKAVVDEDTILVEVDPYKGVQAWQVQYFAMLPKPSRGFLPWLWEDFFGFRAPGPS